MQTRTAVAAMVACGLCGVCAGWLLFRGGGGGEAAGTDREFTASVVRVSDGDTLEVAPVQPPGPNEKVRLLGIDAPGEAKPLYKESWAALATLTKGGQVRVEFDRPGRGARDDYDRVLGYVFVGDQNVNIELVRQGWSVYSSKHGGERFAAELRAAEDEARSAKRGVWKVK